MQKIFIGMLLVFFNLNLDLGHNRIGLIPTFIGYLVMLVGLREMAEQSEWFAKAQGLARLMFVYAGVLYVLDFSGMSYRFGLWGISPDTITASNAVLITLGVVSVVVPLLISHRIIRGVMDIERAQGRDLFSAQLESRWRVMVLCAVLSFLFALMPAMGIIAILVGFVAHVFFLVAFNRAKNAIRM